MESNKKAIVTTNQAPAPIGPYSQATAIGDLMFTSGQIPLNPETGAIPEGIEAQTRQSLSNVKAILEANNSGMDKVLKTTVFLKNMEHFQAMNAVYAEFFDSDTAPARSAVEVARLPKDVLIEVEVIAHV